MYHEVTKSFFGMQSSINRTHDMQIMFLSVEPTKTFINEKWSFSKVKDTTTKIEPMLISIKKHSIGENTPQNEVNSLGHAEYIFLHNIINGAENCDTWDVNDGEISDPILLRMSNRIAQKTRRGFGNYFIYHPSNNKLISQSIKHLSCMYPTPNCPKDKIVCVYKGKHEMDTGFVYSDLGDKKYLTKIPTNKAMDYIQTLPLLGVKC